MGTGVISGMQPLPQHRCWPRSERARAFACVFTQYDGTAWHHQILVRDDSQPIAISFCPFCGVELERKHFEDPP